MILLLLTLACADSADDTAGDGTVDDSGTVEDTGGFCADVPVVNYDNFGQGFMTGNCQGCHASTTENRYGAPEDISFDTVEQVWELSELILLVATGDSPAMPPAGGVPEDDLVRLEWWLRCAVPGT